MKRFYCTICKKIKHVRVMPQNVVNVESTIPEQRVGQCRRHVTARVYKTRRVVGGVN